MQTDTLGRRSRFRRTCTGKRLVLTDRDIRILQLLYRYRYLRQPQLTTFLKPKSEKRFIERLGDLFHETGLINRPKRQWQQFDARFTPMIYELSSKGRTYLEDHELLSLRATTLSRKHSPSGSPQFQHAMMIIDVLVSTELSLVEYDDKRFVCVDEILARAPAEIRNASNPLSVPVTIEPCSSFPEIKNPWNTHIIPDGLYGIEYLIDGKKRYRFWALECENTSPKKRGTIRNSSLVRKQAAYDALIKSQGYRNHWGIPNLKLQVCTRKDVEEIRQSFSKLTKKQDGAVSYAFQNRLS